MKEKKNPNQIIDSKIPDYVVKQLIKKGASEVIVNSSYQNKTQIKFVNNGITAITNWDSKNIGVFVNYKKRLVSTSIESFGKSAIDLSLKKLVALAKFCEQNNEHQGIAKGPFKYKKIAETYDRKIENLGNKATDIVQEGIQIALKEGANRVSGNFEYSTIKSHLLSSEKVEVYEKGTLGYFTIRAFANKDASGHKTATTRMLNKLDYKYASKKAAFFASNSKNPTQINGGKYDIIFDPMSFAVILDNIASAASIFSVESGFSFFNDSLNKKVANENVTLTDDGTIPNGYASTTSDDEGYPTSRKNIIENGIFKNYLHNTSTAKRYNVKSTGNAGLIAPEPLNIILKSGKINEESLFKSVDKGLYITNIWYTRYKNHATGDFSTIPRDAIFFIENGKLKKAVKDIRISDNMKNILNNINQISNKSEQVMGWETEKPVFTPFVCVKNINITKSN